MKKLVLLVMMVVLGMSAFAQNIGVVNYQKVVSNYKGYKDAINYLEQEKSRLQGDIDKRVAEYQKLEEKVRNNKNATDEEKQNLQRELNSLNQYVETMKQILSKTEYEQMNTVKSDINVVIQEVAKEKKLDVVLDSQVVITGGIDISEIVIERLANTEKISLD
ncbi:MAG: outer membrane protein [Fusobacteriaceae bacterium]|nr:outer membrane protein [Fusobacteriaceae bacterium]